MLDFLICTFITYVLESTFLEIQNQGCQPWGFYHRKVRFRGFLPLSVICRGFGDFSGISGYIMKISGFFLLNVKFGVFSGIFNPKKRDFCVFLVKFRCIFEILGWQPWTIFRNRHTHGNGHRHMHRQSYKINLKL